jgi:Xaa-Pro aminopeptidase
MDRVKRLMSNIDADAVVIMNGTSPFLDSVFWYLTEQRSGTFEGTIAIASDEGLDVIVNKLEETSARGGSGNIHVFETRDEREKMLKDLLKDKKRIGMNVHSVSYAAAEYIKKVSGSSVVDVTKGIHDTISIKDKNELSAIRKACGTASITASSIHKELKEGMSEKDAAAWIDTDMRNNGAEGNAFETISAFGEYSAEPHHRPCERKLMKGDTALFDFGCKISMYSSDLTRTVFFGDPPEILKRAYKVVAEAKEAGMTKIADGIPAKEADLAAREVIDASEFKGMFIHSFGHGIGMDVHEGTSLSHLSKDVLKENMVVSAEPGIYIPGVGGIRIEDTVLVKKNGCESLTKFDQSMTVIQ